MPNTNSSFSALSRADQLRKQVEKLETITRTPADQKDLEQFDKETEALLHRVDGREVQMTAYKYATMAEAEAFLNLPESAQEPTSRNLVQKSIQQRRQMLLGLISEMETMEEKEAEVLTGEDKEDPPGLG